MEEQPKRRGITMDKGSFEICLRQGIHQVYYFLQEFRRRQKVRELLESVTPCPPSPSITG
jgi:hypothetical protein